MMTHDSLIEAIPDALATADLIGFGEKQAGKVRDMYLLKDGSRALIATDRVSAFDVVLGTIPYKGQTLNQLSAWWFDHVKDIVSNHVISVPDPNVMIVRDAQPLPVEVIVRGYITGVTKTSLWTLYAAGERNPYGVSLPDGLQKNDELAAPIITPTTKAGQGSHDERLSRKEIIENRLVNEELWLEVERAAISLFRRGQEVARNAGLILVDTKYEFGLIDGKLAVIDEIHTPDSSRYWTRSSYKDDKSAPKNFDKEFLREWYVAHGYRGEGVPPRMPDATIAHVAERYIAAYEMLTGQVFQPGTQPALARIQKSLGAT